MRRPACRPARPVRIVGSKKFAAALAAGDDLRAVGHRRAHLRLDPLCAACRLISGPTSVVGSSGSPSFSVRVLFDAAAASSGSKMRRSTSTRFTAQQIWPLPLVKRPRMSASAASSDIGVARRRWWHRCRRARDAPSSGFGRVLEDRAAGFGAAGHRRPSARRRRGPAPRRPSRPPGDHLMRGARQSGLPRGARRSCTTVSGHSSGGLVITALPAASAAGDLVRPEFGRIVERHDRGDDAARLAQRHRQRTSRGRERNRAAWRAEDALRLLGIAPEDADRRARPRRVSRRVLPFSRRATGRAILTVAFDRIGGGAGSARRASARASPPSRCLPRCAAPRRARHRQRAARHGIDQLVGRRVADRVDRAVGASTHSPSISIRIAPLLP